MIILEGMDGCGKSTLATKLGLQVIHPGAPPRTPELEEQFFRKQQGYAGLPVVYDRVTCISQQVYRKRMFDEWYHKPLRKLVETPYCTVVHCRPPDEFVLNIDNHTVAEHDTPEMLQLVRDNAKLFLDSYDRLMKSIPHLVYDFTTTDFQSFYDKLINTQYHYREWAECTHQQNVIRRY